MNKELIKLINQIQNIFNKRSEEFTYKNCEGDIIGVIDYCSDIIPKERVELDLELMKDILKMGKELLDVEDFHILIAAFCNYYIEEGMNIVLNNDKFGLDSYFSSCDDKDVVYCIFKGITTQDYAWFESAYEIDNKCTVAKIYLFVKGMAELTYAIATDRHISTQMENNVWKYYEELNNDWKEYVIQDVKEYPNMDKNPLPYIACSSDKNHMIQMLKDYLQDILEELKIDITEVDPTNLYSIICEKYGTTEAVKLIMDFSRECSEKYQYNITPNQKIIPKNVKKGIAEMHEKMINCFQNVVKALLEGEINRGNTYYNTVFLYEKLGYILLDSENEQKKRTKFITLPYPDSSSSPLYRYDFLHIPIVPYETMSKSYILGRYKIFVSNRELIQKNEEIEKLNNEKTDMMDYYAHSWKHISYPKIVKDVAEALFGKEDDESITMANKLLRAYNSEQTLKHGIQLLQYSISSKKETVQKEFQKGFWMIDLPKEDGIVGIETILNECLDMVILRLMMEDIDTSKRMKKCRARIANIEELREEYTECFLRKKKKNQELFQWVNDNLFNINIEISEEWNRIRIDKESFSAAQMTEIMVELFTNILLHGGENAKIKLSSDMYSMDIIVSNECNQVFERKSGKGLKTLSKVIDKINFDSKIEEGLERITEDNAFTVHIRLNKKLIYKD